MALFAIIPSFFSCWEHEDCRESDALHSSGKVVAPNGETVAYHCARARWVKGRTHVASYRQVSKVYWTHEGETLAQANRYNPSWVEEGPPRAFYHELYVSHVGRVVATGVDYNVQVMSDVREDVSFCVVQEDDGTYKKHARTCLCEPYIDVDERTCWAVVDASAQDRLAYAFHLIGAEIKRRADADAYDSKRRAELSAKEAKEPRKGRQVRVVRGRKVPIGTTGVCIWVGDGQYGSRVGVKDSKGVVHWTAASNVEAIV